ncbi:PP2C family protein-serine/threonine phosphatase [Trujillonella humicola]|uniref:PP2C family protein-serine/threonine phosphatase n=1 Tax=Trujillonella humicola TaxID=3383699 RepID=UPI0039057A37
MGRGDGIDVGALLELVEAAPPVEAVDAVAAALAELVDAREVSLLLADFSGRAIVRLTTAARDLAPDAGSRAAGEERAETIPLPGSRYERVLRTQDHDVERVGDLWRVVVPVTDRGDAIGLVELLLPAEPVPAVLAEVRTAAHALGYVVIAARRHTDLFEWGQRTTPFSLAAEIQRRLLPASYTCEAGQFTLAGWLEPAGEVGGDTFDYTLDRRSLHLSISDAVGHQVPAALLATLLVGALRNGRRRGHDLAAQAAEAGRALAAEAAPGQFVTGQLLRIDLETATATAVNAGHPFPLRLRDGRVTEVPLAIDAPFGVSPEVPYRVQSFPLEPGDRLVFLTDGMLERNAATLDVSRALAASADLHPREVVHELGAAVLAATGGNLRDDATMLCLDWYGGPPRVRTSEQGADRARTSGPPSV